MPSGQRRGRWSGVPLPDRQALRRDELIAAGIALLGSPGGPNLTVRAVCKAAGLTERYFYESFDNTQALLTAVYDRVESAMLDRLRATTPGSDLRATVRAALLTCADFFEEDPRRARILLREPLTDDVLREHSARRSPAFLLALTPIFGAEPLVARTAETLAITGTAMAGALVALYLDWVDGRLTVTRDHLVDSAVEIVLALLSTRLR